MKSPRLTPDVEQKRDEIVEKLDEKTIRKDGALESVAEAVSSICQVPMAHVSLMERAQQCVIGHVGMEHRRFDRDETFCAYTIAAKEVTIVENAHEDYRFCENPYVTGEPGISFYVGLPLLVDDTPVGTLCALDTEPRSLGVKMRGELFGLVNAVESYLAVIYLHGPQSVDHEISSTLTGIRAIAAKERYRGEEDQLSDSMRQIEVQASKAFDCLRDRPTYAEIGLGMETTDEVLHEDTDL